MKPTLDIQEIVSALGIDPFRFLDWQEKEIGLKDQPITPIEEHKDTLSAYGLMA
jgi:hypothetical protein